MPRATPKASPKSMLLDLLRVTPGREIPVRQLLAASHLMGFTPNSSRVALARLQSRGIVESTERGAYRLAPRTDPVSRFVDSWRLGESRLRTWDGNSWICTLLPKGTPRARRARSLKALSFLGFHEGLPTLWVRPDNLSLDLGALRALLAAMGIEEGAGIFVGSEFPPSQTRDWIETLRKSSGTAAAEKALRALRESRARLPGLGSQAALRETFLVGGAAIRALALDPLLPDEISSGDLRRQLTAEMIAYDTLGRGVWSEFLGNLRIGEAPGHLAGLPSSVSP